jgi:hypothetical protein
VPTSLRSKLPVVVCIDVEPEGRAIDPDDRADWRGFESACDYFSALRPRLAAATRAPVHFSWFVRMDPQIERVYGSAAWAAIRYAELLRRLEDAGDEIGLHLHFWRFDDAAYRWFSDFADQHWIDHCVETSFAAFRRSFGRPCRSSRVGDRWLNDATVALLERLGARVDLTIEPGQGPPALEEPFVGALPDYRSAPRAPYRPAASSFLTPAGAAERQLWLLPLSTGRLEWAFAGLARRREGGTANAGRPAYEGWHDLADEGQIAGWAFDANHPDHTVSVEIHDGRSLLARVDAGSFRPDLLAAGKGDGRHGFALPIPDRLRDGTVHEISVAITGTQVRLAETPKQLCCTAGPRRDDAAVTFHLGQNPALLGGMIETALERDDAPPHLAFIMRSSQMLSPDDRAHIEQNLEYLRSRRDADRFAFVTPAETIRLLDESGRLASSTRARPPRSSSLR